jgi:hypothetical protein
VFLLLCLPPCLQVIGANKAGREKELKEKAVLAHNFRIASSEAPSDRPAGGRGGRGGRGEGRCVQGLQGRAGWEAGAGLQLERAA